MTVGIVVAQQDEHVKSATLSVPEEVADAVRAEAYRRLCRPGEVLSDWLHRTFPDYVRDRMRHDFDHPLDGAVIETRAEIRKRPST